ncbi:MMPL family transporter [Salinactinospora qingdaonensis]
MGKLSEVQSNDEATFLPLGAESTKVQEVAADFADRETVPAIVVYSADRTWTPQRLAELSQDAERIAAADGVAGEVTGPIPGPEDDTVAQLVVPLSEDVDTAEATDELREVAGEQAGAGVTVQVTGPAGFAADLSAAFAGIDGTLLAVALGAVLVILVAVYRSPLLPFVVIVAAMLALVLAAAVVYVAADTGWLQLNGQSQGILFILVVGACTDYALLLVSRYRETLVEHRRPVDAVVAAVGGTVQPILASGGTVILGVLCLLAGDLASNRSLGPVAALGIAAALASALTFLPAVLLLLGRAAFWPARPHYSPSAQAQAGPLEAVYRRHGVWARVARTVGRRPRLWWIGATLVLVAAAAFVPQFRAEGTSQSEIFRTEVEAVSGQETLERGFGSASTAAPAQIVTDADRVEEVVTAAESVDGVTAATPVPEGEAAPQDGPAGVQPEPKVVDGRALVRATLAEEPQSTEAVEVVRELRAQVGAVSGANALVGGTTAVQLDTLDTAQRDLTVIVALVLVVVLLVLIVLLRALVAPLLLVATTVLSFGSALGVGALVFNHLLGFPGADPVVPLFAFVFLVALGIDYNIFLMTRAREETLEHGTREGTLRALTVTGGVITSAGVVLAATFAALAVIPLLFLAQLAFLVAFGVLLDALLVRSVLVPALALDAGRWIWWPGRAFRREPAGSS